MANDLFEVFKKNSATFHPKPDAVAPDADKSHEAVAQSTSNDSNEQIEISVKDCLYSMTIRMPDAWKEDLEKAANADGIDMSNYVVRAVGDLLRANNPSLPQVEKTRRRNLRTRR